MANLRAKIDLNKKAEVYNIEEVRDWKTLFLKKREKRTKVFVGYINTYYRDGWKGDILEIVDEKHRENQYYRINELENLKYRQVDDLSDTKSELKVEFIER